MVGPVCVCEDSRSVEVGRVERVRELCDVPVDQVPVAVGGVVLPGRLVFGEVPTCGELRLQSLENTEK